MREVSEAERECGGAVAHRPTAAPLSIGDRVWIGISSHHYTVVSDRQPVVGVPGRFEYVVQPDDSDNSWAVEERFIHRLPQPDGAHQGRRTLPNAPLIPSTENENG